MSMQQLVSVTIQTLGASSFAQQMGGIGNSANLASSAVGRLTGYAGMAKAAIAGLVGGFTLSSIGSLGSAFENTQNKMAGFMYALGEAPDFQAGLAMAEGTMRKIELTAAKLPGEAEDYVRVFTTALPQVQKSLGGTMDEMMKFTNDITAIGSTFGIDSMQIAHDLQRMLQVGRGGAGLDVRTFTEMLPFLQKVEGQANLTAESFNKMTAEKRAEILKASFQGLAPMIDNAQNSWDALVGTVTTTARTLFRESTEPLFEGMKRGMAGVSALFFDADGNMTKLGSSIAATGTVFSEYIVLGVEKAIEGFQWLGENGASIVDRIFGHKIDFFAEQLGMQEDDQGNVSFTGNLATAADNLATAFSYVTGVLEPLWQVVQYVETAMQVATFEALPGFTEGILAVVVPLVDFASSMIAVVGTVVDEMWPMFAGFGEALGDLASGIGTFLGPVIHVLGGVFLWLIEVIRDYVMPVIHFFVYGIGAIAQIIGDVLKWLGEGAAEFYGMNQTKPEQQTGTLDKVSNGFSDMIKKITAERDKKKEEGGLEGMAKHKGRDIPKARGGTHVTQDFRWSKFTIDQQFAEGYDPDRVAVVFSKDVGRIGAQRLQSGFEPLFSLGT